MNHRHYRHLLIMTVLSFVSMYVLMYAMVNAFGKRVQQRESGLYGGTDDSTDGRD